MENAKKVRRKCEESHSDSGDLAGNLVLIARDLGDFELPGGSSGAVAYFRWYDLAATSFFNR